MSPLRKFLSYLVHLTVGLLTGPAFCLKTSQMLAHLLAIKMTGQTVSFKVTKGCLYAYQVLVFTRLVAFNVFLLLRRHHQPGAPTRFDRPADPILNYLEGKYSFMNQYTFALIGLLLLFALFIDFSLSFQMDYRLTRAASDILMLNVRQCVLPSGGTLYGHAQTSPAFWAAVRKLPSRGRCVHFTGAKLETFPDLSRGQRIRLVGQAVYSETLFGSFNLITGLVATVFWSWHLLVGFAEMSPCSRLLASLDLTLLAYSFFDAIRMGFFSINIIYVLRCLFRGHMGDLKGNLTQRRRAFERSPTDERARHLESQLRAFARQRHQLYFLLEHLNTKVVSNLLGVSLLTNILVNVVMLSLLLLLSMTPLERAFVLFVISLQGFIFYASEILSSLSGTLYLGSGGQLYRAQGALKIIESHGRKGRILSSKLTLLKVYELICTKKKFFFTAGAIAIISKRALYEFLYAYSAFFMFTFKLLRKMHVGNC